jgi:hypothetical protein
MPTSPPLPLRLFQRTPTHAETCIDFNLFQQQSLPNTANESILFLFFSYHVFRTHPPASSLALQCWHYILNQHLSKQHTEAHPTSRAGLVRDANMDEQVPMLSTTQGQSSALSFKSSQALRRDSFQDLFEPPAPASRLQPVFSRGSQKPTRSYFQNVIKYSLVAVLLSWLGWFLGTSLWTGPRIEISYLTDKTEDADRLVLDTKLPAVSKPVIFMDEQGAKRWTVAMPADTEYPLLPNEYSDICTQAHGFGAHLMADDGHTGHSHGHFGYYHVDKSYMDIDEVEQKALLPGRKAADMSENICNSSLTYVLEANDAGLGVALMALWTSYGLAKKEGRAFFVDDRNWAYGNYSSYFRDIPQNPCQPPPDRWRVPCPHQAKHLLISSGTISHVYGHGFVEEFEDAHGMGVQRQKNIFDMMRAGYKALFRLAEADRDFLKTRLHYIDSQIRSHNGLMLGVHVRHGDRHPKEYKYQKSYLPLERYPAAAEKASEEFASQDVGIDTLNSRIVVASDDPAVYSASEFSNALRAQYLQSLTSDSSSTDFSVALSGKAPGFEGGFSQQAFLQLGQAKDKALDVDAKPTEAVRKLRSVVARSYLLDLAVLQTSDVVVCTVSSSACRLLAVMMGWERAIEQKRWVNIDGDFDWQGIIW